VPCSTATAKSVVTVGVDVKNTGAVDGEEVVFLFASYPGSKVATRVEGYKELKGFQRVAVKAGQTAHVTIPVRVADLWYWDAAAKAAKVEAGTVKLMVGGSSASLPLSDTMVVQ
jgi:beta-glucosidase